MKKRLVALLLVLVLIVPCAFASGEVYYRLKKSAKVWQFPNYKSRVIDTYKQDWALTISKKVDKTWAKVLFTNGQDGYIEKTLLKRCTSSTAWVTKDKIKVRRGPNYTFATVYTVNRGDKVTVLTAGAGYSYIKTDEGCGYIEKGALSSKKVNPTAGAAQPKYKDVNYTAWVVSNGGKVGLRTKASTTDKSSKLIASYKPCTQVTVLKEGKDFCYVSVDGKEGYMRTKYLSKNEPATIPTPTPKPVFSPYTATVTPKKAGAKVKLHIGQGEGWSVKKWLTEGTVVTVVAQCKDPYWVKVEVDGTTGYMDKRNLK